MIRTTPRWYVLEGKQVRPARNMMEGVRAFEDFDKRRVAETYVGEVRISTVFLGLDHSYSDDGPPLVFETLVFGGLLDGDMERYSTWGEAEAGHARMVTAVYRAMH